MGCDIHLFAEKRDGDVWKFLPAPGDGHDWDEKKKAEEAGREYDCPYPYRYMSSMCKTVDGRDIYGDEDSSGPHSLHDWFDDHNYRLFGMLANVRNGFGFAGVDTGDAVTPVAVPKGIPNNACPEYKAECESWGADGHSHSYFTVAELRAYFAKFTGKQGIVRGVVTGKQYEELKDNGIVPKSWSGGISGKNLMTMSPDQYDIARPKVQHRDNRDPWEDHSSFMVMENTHPGMPSFLTEVKIYVHAEWPVPYLDAAGNFILLLDELETYGTPDDVRIVFFFDN